MFKLTLAFEDSLYPTFKDAFHALDSWIKKDGYRFGEMLPALLWITPPQSNVPMFFNDIREQAIREGLI